MLCNSKSVLVHVAGALGTHPATQHENKDCIVVATIMPTRVGAREWVGRVWQDGWQVDEWVYGWVGGSGGSGKGGMGGGVQLSVANL